MAGSLPPLLFAALVSSFLKSACGFSFSFVETSPAVCDKVEVRWQGGQEPWSLTIIPAYDYPQLISIPSSSFDSQSNTGSYQWTVNYPTGTRFVAMMSDGTGTGTGGVSPLYSVSGGSSSACSLRSTKTDFLFYLNETSITQCQSVGIYWDASAVAPVSIIGAIPGGQVFQLVSGDGTTTSLAWNTNVKEGTDVILAAFDSGGLHQGGSSSLLTVKGSSNNACLDSSSPSSTPSGSQMTETGSIGGTKTDAAGVKTVTAITTEIAAKHGGAGLSTGAIVGIVVSAVLVAAVAQVALIWFCCRRQIRALIYHRREMQGQEVKPGAAVDLGLTTRNSYISAFDHDPTLGPGEDASNARESRYSINQSSRAPLPFELDAQSSISPFWDGAVTAPQTRSGIFIAPSNHSPTLKPLEFDSETEPLQLPQAFRNNSHNSHGSISSFNFTIPETIGESPPSLASHATNSPLISAVPDGQIGTTSVGGAMSKAQMATMLDGQQTGRPEEDFGARLPPQEAPIGGFRRHKDAGRLNEPLPTAEANVEDLPPMYEPEWETESQRRKRKI
nr:hypothetical protein L204_00208 [Cryptococcus depauperatus CBS 7855]